MKRSCAIWAALTVLALTACGSTQTAPSAARSSPSSAPTTVTPAPPAPAPVAPSSSLPQVPDFPVVAYQGDSTFGGHDGHLRSVFAAGRPVVLLYFGGL